MFFFITPVSFERFIRHASNEEANHERLENLVDKVLDSYFSSTFELITELCDEETVEFSYLLDYFSKDHIPLLLLNDDKKPGIVEKYYKKLIVFLESLVVWAMDSKSTYHLTESVNLLLKLRDDVQEERPQTNNSYKGEVDDNRVNSLKGLFLKDSNSANQTRDKECERKNIEPQYNQKNQDEFIEVKHQKE